MPDETLLQIFVLYINRLTSEITGDDGILAYLMGCVGGSSVMAMSLAAL